MPPEVADEASEVADEVSEVTDGAQMGHEMAGKEVVAK
jgi:hypothetical protein